jgi:hypothetical protein
MLGMPGRAMPNVIVAGETDPVVMVSLAKGKLCSKRGLTCRKLYNTKTEGLSESSLSYV